MLPGQNIDRSLSRSKTLASIRSLPVAHALAKLSSPEVSLIRSSLETVRRICASAFSTWRISRNSPPCSCPAKITPRSRNLQLSERSSTTFLRCWGSTVPSRVARSWKAFSHSSTVAMSFLLVRWRQRRDRTGRGDGTVDSVIRSRHRRRGRTEEAEALPVEESREPLRGGERLESDQVRHPHEPLVDESTAETPGQHPQEPASAGEWDEPVRVVVEPVVVEPVVVEPVVVEPVVVEPVVVEPVVVEPVVVEPVVVEPVVS